MTEIWRPSVTVAAIIEREGRFLFVEEVQDGRRVLNQPAGHLDPGETLIAACAREVLEETAHRFAPAAPAELKERASMHRSPLVQQCLDDYLAGRNFSLELLSKTHG